MTNKTIDVYMGNGWMDGLREGVFTTMLLRWALHTMHTVYGAFLVDVSSGIKTLCSEPSKFLLKFSYLMNRLQFCLSFFFIHNYVRNLNQRKLLIAAVLCAFTFPILMCIVHGSETRTWDRWSIQRHPSKNVLNVVLSR